MSFDPESWPHLEVQTAIKNLLITALRLSEDDKKPSAQERRSSLLTLCEDYQKTVDTLTETVPKQCVLDNKDVIAKPNAAAANASSPKSTLRQDIRATRMQKPSAMRVARRPIRDFRRAVIKWRKRNGLSQVQAASQLGISARTLQDWEQARYLPNPIIKRYILGLIVD